MYLLALLLGGVATSFMPFSYIYLLALNIYMMLCSRKNYMLLFVAFVILLCDYSVVYAIYIHFTSDAFINIISQSNHITSLNLLVLFNALLFVCFKWERIGALPQQNLFMCSDKCSRAVPIVLILLLLYIFFRGYSAPEEIGGRGESSSMYEYSSILFILYFFYCGNERIYRRIGLFLVICFSGKSFLYGGRIEGIQFILVAFFMLYAYKTNIKLASVGILLMFVLMSIVGSVRGSLLQGNFDLAQIVGSIFEGGLALDTSYYAYYASEASVYALGVVSPNEVWTSFVDFVKGIFVGANPETLLPTISNRYVSHQGGCFLPFTFYFYMRSFGVLLITLLLSYYLSIVKNVRASSSGFKKCFAVWIVCSVFRWYIYSPAPLLRGALLFVLFYFFVGLLNKPERILSFSR